MNLKYSIQHKIQQIDFHVNAESGSLIIEANGELESIEVPFSTALELVEVIRFKLYDHQNKKQSIIQRLFK
jgi:hypothetical protein